MRFLLILLVIYLILRTLFKYVLPTFIAREVERRVNDLNNNPPHMKEGEVRVDATPKKNAKDKGDGEYVEYEEVK